VFGLRGALLCLLSGIPSAPPPPHSVTVCRFASAGDDWFVLVGVAKDMILNPRSVAGGFIYTYRLASAGDKLEFMHKVSPCSCTPPALCSLATFKWLHNDLISIDNKHNNVKFVTFPLVAKLQFLSCCNLCHWIMV